MLQFPVPSPANFFFQRLLALEDEGSSQGLIDEIDFVGDHVYATILEPNTNIGRVYIDFTTENGFDDTLAYYLSARAENIALNDANSYTVSPTSLTVLDSSNFGYNTGDVISEILIPDFGTYKISLYATFSAPDSDLSTTNRFRGTGVVSPVVDKYVGAVLSKLYTATYFSPIQSSLVSPSFGNAGTVKIQRLGAFQPGNKLKLRTFAGAGGAFTLGDTLVITVSSLQLVVERLTSFLEGFEEV